MTPRFPTANTTTPLVQYCCTLNGTEYEYDTCFTVEYLVPVYIKQYLYWNFDHVLCLALGLRVIRIREITAPTSRQKLDATILWMAH